MNTIFYSELDAFLKSVSPLAGIKSRNTRKVYHMVAYAGRKVSVTEIVDATGLKQPSVSVALSALKKAGIVVVEKSGNFRYYRIDTKNVNDITSRISIWQNGNGHH